MIINEMQWRKLLESLKESYGIPFFVVIVTGLMSWIILAEEDRGLSDFECIAIAGVAIMLLVIFWR